MMKVLITGATGFIGSHLTECLASRGYRVRCLLRNSSNTRWLEHCILLGKQGVVPEPELVTGDCLDENSLYDALNGVDVVIHLAGLTKAVREEDFFRINLDGTKTLIQAIKKSETVLRRFVFISSLAASGPSPDGSPVKEDDPPSPVSFYGKSKYEAEKVVMENAEIIPFTIIRPPAVYGPRDCDFYVFFKLVKRGIFPYWGRSLYSMVYIDDLINGIILSIEKEVAKGKIYFISDKNAYTNEEIAFTIARILGKRLRKVRLPRSLMPLLASIGEKIKSEGIINRDKIRELGHACWVCDPSRAERELGYKSMVTLGEGLKWTADWYRINRWI